MEIKQYKQLNQLEQLRTLENAASHFLLGSSILRLEKIDIGHINLTYRIFTDGDTDYIIQRINTSIFLHPTALMQNIRAVTDFLRKKIILNGGDPSRQTLTLVKTTDGKDFFEDESGFYRVYIFIKNARTYNSASRPGLFGSAGEAFGRFQGLLSDFPSETLFETIRNFHDTPKRLSDFFVSVEKNASGRADAVKDEIDFISARKAFCSSITKELSAGTLPLRVTHNDTKLNNVLIDDQTGKGVCVIDLDTVMPGSLLYDFGDSIRFGASSAAEDEADIDKVYMDLGLFREYTAAFLSQTRDSITPLERALLPVGAIMMTLECGMRFLADYIDGDKYFSTHYPEQNLRRARTQIKLVKDMEEKLQEMQKIVKEV